jgi:hypothetical protein
MNKRKGNYVWYGVAALVLVSGLATAGFMTASSLTSYPALIGEAYKSPLQRVEAPGEGVVDLTREGAYGVYLETDYVPTEGPPAIECRLTSEATSENIPLVKDYVPTNRYSTKDGKRVGVLIYSTTINEPSLHTLSCDYPDGRVGPKLVLAIGPNYVFEFLRVAWNMSGPLLGGVGILCGSLVLSLCIAGAVFLRTRGGGLQEK